MERPAAPRTGRCGDSRVASGETTRDCLKPAVGKRTLSDGSQKRFERRKRFCEASLSVRAKAHFEKMPEKCIKSARLGLLLRSLKWSQGNAVPLRAALLPFL